MHKASAQTIVSAPRYGLGDGLVIAGTPAPTVEIRTSVVGDVGGATLLFEPTRQSVGIRANSQQATITNRGFAAGRVGILAEAPLTISDQAGPSFVALRLESTPDSGDFAAQPRFLIQPIQAPTQTAAQYYAYNTPTVAPHQFNYNGPSAASLVPNVQPRAANLLFLDASDDRAFVSVFGRPRGNPTSPGGLFGGSVRVSGGASSSLALSDDNPSAGGGITRSETTCDAPCSGSPWNYTVYTGWAENNNDGFVILYDKNGAVVDFRATGPPQAVDQITIFDATSLDPNDAPIIVLEAITLGQRLRFEEFVGGVVEGIDAGVRFTGASGIFTNTGIVVGGIGVDAIGDLRLDGGTGAPLEGSITGTSGPGIRIGGRLVGDVLSLATVVGATAGIEIADLGGATFANSGRVTGGTGAGLEAGGVGTVSNTALGTIESTTGPGLRIAPSATMSLTNAGTIRGGTHGVVADGALQLQNSGQIQGQAGDGIVAAQLGGDVVNTAEIRGAARGIAIADLAGFRVVNAGSITGGTGPGVQLGGAGTLVNEAAGVISSTSGIAISATERLSIDNAGVIRGTITFGSADDAFILRASGVEDGTVDGGAGRNRLQIEAGAAGRTILAGQFVRFQTVDLNTNGGAGPVVLGSRGAEDATLDAGPDGRIVLHSAELKLVERTSATRAGLTEIAAPARLSGNGEVIGNLTVAGTVSPGNSIGLLPVTGNYTQTGPYEVEFRPPPLGRSRGRNLAEGTAASLAEQDADLILVSGTATLTAGTLVPVALGTAAQFAAARAASPTGELRYLVLRAQGGLGGTRYASLSNVATVRTEYPANGTDVELVVSGTPGGLDDDGDDRPVILVTSAPPPSLPARDGTLRQWGLSQNGVLFDLAADCDRPIGLSAAARDESWCSFGQGRLLTASGEGSDGLSVYGGAWAQSGLGQSRLRVADAAAGVMRRVRDEAWLGLAVGYGLGWSDFGGAGGDAFKTSFNALQLAGLGRWARGSLELRGMLGYGWSEVESRRPSGLRGGDPRLVADYDLQQATAAGEARWWFGTRGARAVAPTLRLTGARQWRGGYSEEGTSADRFTAERATWDSLRMLLGVTGEIGTSLAGTPLVVEPRLGWLRELGDRAVTVTGRYAGAPGEMVRGRGGAAPRDSAVVGLAGIAQLTGSTRLRLGYDGAWYEGGSSHSVTMRLSYAW